MDSIEFSQENNKDSLKNHTDPLQQIVSLISLYVSSRWEDAGLSIRKVGFHFFSYGVALFSLSLFFVVGLFLFFYGLIQGVSTFTDLPEWILYLIHGVLLISIPLFIIFFLLFRRKKRFLRKRIEKFKKEINEENISNQTELIIQLSQRKFKDEEDFLKWKQSVLKDKVIGSYKKIKKSMTDLVDLRQWVVRFPWESTGISLLSGFCFAIYVSSPSETITSDSDLSNMSRSLSYFAQLGTDILKQSVPSLILSQLVHSAS